MGQEGEARSSPDPLEDIGDPPLDEQDYQSCRREMAPEARAVLLLVMNDSGTVRCDEMSSAIRARKRPGA